MLAELLPPHVWQIVTEALPVIASLIIIEGLLSVDNALAIAAMAAHLPGRQKYWALRVGIIGAYVFRGLALMFAMHIAQNPWLKLLGAIYLVHLMAHHFAGAHRRARQLAIDTANRGFWGTVATIELMDLSLGIDNVVAAVALSDEFWIICTGVFIGVLALRFVAGFCIKLIEKLPILEHTAFLLIGYVGVLLMVELAFHWDIRTASKFAGIALIIAVTLAYAKNGAVRAVIKPALPPLLVPLRVYDFIVGGIFSALFLPFRAASNLIHLPVPADLVEAAVETQPQRETLPNHEEQNMDNEKKDREDENENENENENEDDENEDENDGKKHALDH